MGFLHEHKLSHEHEFDALLKGGKSIMCYPLRFLYIAEKSGTASFKIAISVPKKRFHDAVDRNLIKRRIREGVRHSFQRNNFEQLSLQILIVYCTNSPMPQSVLEEKIEKGFKIILTDAGNH